MHMIAENLGKIVRMVWIDYCKQTGKTDNPDHIAPWEELNEWGKEVDRRIGVEIYNTVSAQNFEELYDMQVKLFRAEKALELLDAIMPYSVAHAKKIVAGFDPDNTLGGHCLQLANGIDKMRE